MIQCQCGYCDESGEFQFCPKCGEKLPGSKPEGEYVTPNSVTLSWLKRIIERSEQPLGFSVLTAIDGKGKPTPMDSAEGLLIEGIDPEDGMAYPLGGRKGNFVSIGPRSFEIESGGEKEALLALEIFIGIGAKKPGLLDDFSWADAANQLNSGPSTFGSFYYDYSQLRYHYMFPIFSVTTEEEVRKVIQQVYGNVLLCLRPVVERLPSIAGKGKPASMENAGEHF